MNFKLSKVNHYGFLVINLLVFLFIGYKVFHVPITHDEVATTVFYSNFSFWEIMMYPDQWPNNHILNTLLSKCTLFIFGGEQWAVRLPNLLSYLLYAWGAFRILKTVLTKESSFFLAGALLFVANPYLLDFFGLCRGYGMSCALCLFSLSYLISGFSEQRAKHIWIAFLFSILASYANFTLLVFWAATTLLASFYFLSRYLQKKESLIKPALIIFISCIGYLALIAVPLYKMHSTNQFEFWTANGFVSETVIPLIIHTCYDSRVFHHFTVFSQLSGAIIAANAVYIIANFVKAKFKLTSLKQPIFVATTLIVLTASINIFQCWLLDTPNLNGRTALFFYPLFVATVLSTHALFKTFKGRFIKVFLSIAIALLCIFHLGKTVTPWRVREWWYDAYTNRVLNYLDKHREDQAVSLETNWLFNPSFQFYTYTEQVPWLKLRAYNKDILPESDAQYYYILAEDYPQLEANFKPILKFDEVNWLLKNRKLK